MLARSFLLLLGVTIGGGLTYYHQQAEHLRKQDVMQAQLDDRLRNANSQAAINYQAIENLYNEQKARALIDNAMISQYSREIERLNDEVTRLYGELAFYEEMIPAGPDGSVSLRAFEAHQEGRYINFKLMLSVSGRGMQQPFEGRLQFSAVGEKDGEEQTIPLYPEVLPLADAEPTSGSLIGSISQTSGEFKGLDLKAAQMSPILELSFSRIQRREGLLVIPFGFTPKEITLKVLEGKSVKLSKTLVL
ncbi:MAG: hypothetical protein Q4G44_04120 [Alcaligenaceae bacterium]|nr:hypothetical protein [Alcaligenaceae bacterium]